MAPTQAPISVLHRAISKHWAPFFGTLWPIESILSKSYYLKHGIPPQNVRHLLFTFSGNAPDALLTASLQAYPGPINQWGIGLCVEGHAAFIGAVYDRVIADANNP